jgi:DNA-binding IclR family transcriptional regulator
MIEELSADQIHIARLRAITGAADDGRPSRGAAATKVLSVLQAFVAYDNAVSLGELARHTDLPKSTVHRMVGFLRAAGMVDMVDSRFLLTSKVTELSTAVPTGFSAGMRETLLPTLTDLYEATREAVHLSVRCGAVVRVVERVHGRRSAGLVSRFRGPLPLHCTAAGKIVLAGSAQLASAACERRLEAHTPATIVTGERLLAELTSIRKYGVAFDRGEWCSGITGVAAPVWGPGRVLMGAISVVGPVDRLMPDAIARRVSKAAEAASRELHTVQFLPKQRVAS